MTFSIWGMELMGKRLAFLTDKKNTCHHSKYIRITQRGDSLQIVSPEGTVHNIQFKGQHIIVVQNVKTDFLSRLQWNRFRHVLQDAKQLLLTVQDSFLRFIYNTKHKNNIAKFLLV